MTHAPINSSLKPGKLAALVLGWYDRHRRALPWRAAPGEQASAYRVWLSEIMLQQTTVMAVIPYFERFVEQWPDVCALAQAEREDVLRAWAGLGYYARARNLHACAGVVCDELGGRFPQDEAALLALPGIGPYTAAAVSAIAFDRPAVVVDGNIERIMARLHALQTPLPAAKRELKQLAAAHAPQARTGDYAQALMDIGATVCRPKSPLCGACPLSRHCAAYAEGAAEGYPHRAAKKLRPTRRGRVYWLESECGHVLLRRRADNGLLGGMSEFPGSDWTQDGAGDHSEAPMAADWQPVDGRVRHVFTHFTLELEVFTARIPAKAAPPAACRWAPLAGLAGEALPGLMQKVARLVLEHGED